MPLSEALGRLAFSQLWQVTLLIPAAVLLVRFGCRNRCHLAYALLVLVLVKCLVPPLWGSRTGVFSWAEGRLFTEDAARRDVAAAVKGANEHGAVDLSSNSSGRETPQAAADAAPALVTTNDADAALAEISDPRVEATAGANPRMPQAGATASSLPARWSAATVSGWLAAAWGAGIVAIGLIWLRKRLRLKSLCEDSRPAPPDVERLVGRLSRQIGLDEPPQAFVTAEPLMPAAFGIVEPCILLPSHLIETASPEELELVAAHELSHLRRGDAWVGFLQLVTQAVWWFHPLVWWLNREIRRVREQCCDEEVLARLQCRPQQYARCLLNVLELNERFGPAEGLAAMSPFEVTSRRLRHIMRPAEAFRAHMPGACWAVLLAAALVILPGAGVALETRQGLRSTPVTKANESAGETLTVQADNLERPASEKSPVVSTEAPPAPAGSALRYRFDSGARYAYRVNIEADLGEEIETHSGTPTFHVRNVADRTADLLVTGGELMSYQRPKPGRIPSFGVPRVPRFPRMSFPRGGFPMQHELRLDDRGRVISERGGTVLPYVLGTLAGVIFEPLPADGRPQWTISGTTTVRLDQAEDADLPFSRARSPFSPFAGPEPELLNAEESARFVVEPVDADTRRVTKEYALQSVAKQDGEPRMSLTGNGTTLFDVRRGVPTDVQFTARLVIREVNVATTYPLTLTCKLLSADELRQMDEQAAAARAEHERQQAQKAANYEGPAPVAASGRTLESDTPLKPGDLVLVQWQSQWYAADVLEVQDDGKVKVHFRGWGDQWDEAVPRERLQLPPETPPPSSE
jgi:beta-lactamase regulating signal transducer with metallopeptidase domain